MATHHHHHHHASLHLPRLHIPPNFNAPRPTTMEAPIFTPATAFQPAYGLPFALNTPGPMQTPMQTNFFPPRPPGAPARPTNLGHRAMASMAQLAAVGIHPPNGPMTPSIQGQFPPNMMLGQPPFPAPGQPFMPRSRRTPSISTGGPPKAVLGGPNRKVSPMPSMQDTASEKARAKKAPVKLPVEGPIEGDTEAVRSLWSRIPLDPSLIPEQDPGPAPEVTSAELHPDDSSRLPLPPTVDVYLPGKVITTSFISW